LKMDRHHLNVEAYKERIATTKCGFWETLFTLANCPWTAETKDELSKIKAEF